MDPPTKSPRRHKPEAYAEASPGARLPPFEGCEVPHHLHHPGPEKEFLIDNLLVRILSIIEIIRWTGLAPWDYEFPFAGSRTPTFLAPQVHFCAMSTFITKARF